MKTAAQLRAELVEAELREADERETRRKATPVDRRFTIVPTKPAKAHQELYDPACRFYIIESAVANREEAKTAGHSDHMLQGGGMVYVYNTLSNRIVTSTGGGTVWVGAGFTGERHESAHEAMYAISAFLVEHPEGGDITAIVNAHRAR
jgi:hypothetical protein